MTQEQKEKLFFCLVILKGSANNEMKKMPDSEILEILENEIASTMEIFWNLVEENKKLKNLIYNP
jgi:TusA-related sulfurtransferase